MKYFSRIAVAAASVVGFLSTTSPLQAITTLRVSANSGASWTTIRDSAVNPDGSVDINGAIGASGWSIVASGSSALGTLEEPIMELLAGTVTSTRAGTLLIEFSQTGYGPFPDGNSFITTLNSHNVGTGRTTIWTYAGLGNTLFQRSQLLGNTAQSVALGQDVDSVVTTAGLPGYQFPDQYSLTMRLAVFHNGAGTSSFEASLVDPPTRGVPDGGSTVILLGCALIVLAGAANRMQRLGKA